jgi:hypothetical protein
MAECPLSFSNPSQNSTIFIETTSVSREKPFILGMKNHRIRQQKAHFLSLNNHRIRKHLPEVLLLDENRRHTFLASTTTGFENIDQKCHLVSLLDNNRRHAFLA